MANPDSRRRPLLQALSTASISSAWAPVSRDPSTTSTDQPRRVTRLTDWRTLRIERPSSEKRHGQTTASSPIVR